MIKISKIDHCGGQCPWQLFGWTSDDREVYVKYRWGKLRIKVGTPRLEDGEEAVFSEKIGEDGDGYFTLNMLRNYCSVV